MNRMGALILMALACLTGTAAIAAEIDAFQITLDLMVTDCGDVPIDGATVNLNLYRPGEGVLAFQSRRTVDGAVTFHLTGLQCGDEARVTVIPIGGVPDSDHEYTYIGTCDDGKDTGAWDLNAHLDACDDWWWEDDSSAGIIQTIYEIDAD